MIYNKKQLGQHGMTPTEIDEIRDLVLLIEEQVAALDVAVTRINEILE